MLSGKKQTGFTIVELLIVVVVIAILAAITIVAYNGIQNRAKNSAVQSAASQVSKKVALWQVDNPNQTPASLATVGLNLTGSTSSEYSPGSNGVWCATVTSNSVSYFVSNIQATPAPGGCAGHATNGTATITNYARNPRAVSSGASYTNQTPASGNISYQATGAQDGGSAYQVITTVAGQLRVAIPNDVGAVTSTEALSVGVDLYSSFAGQVQLEIGYSTGTYTRSSALTMNVGWNRVQTTIPMTDTGTVSLVQLLAVPTATPAGATWMVSRAIIAKGNTMYNYADGNTTNWVWNGTANSSTSKGTPV